MKEELKEEIKSLDIFDKDDTLKKMMGIIKKIMEIEKREKEILEKQIKDLQDEVKEWKKNGHWKCS